MNQIEKELKIKMEKKRYIRIKNINKITKIDTIPISIPLWGIYKGRH